MIAPWMDPRRLGALWFPSTYGCHALDAEGHCHTRVPDDDYPARHRAEP